MSMISPGIFEESKTFDAPGMATNFRDQRVPGDDGGDVGRAVGGDHVGIGRVDDGDVLLGKLDRVQRPRQQVVGHRKLDEIDLLAGDVGERGLVLQDDGVVAVGEVADDQRGRVDAAAGRDRQRVHVGHRAAVEAAGGVLVDAFDIVVDAGDLDVDAVFVGPFLHDAAVGQIAPRHPADIDRPADLEVLLRRRVGGGNERKLSDAATMIPASLRSIAYPWSRSGLRPDFVLGFRSAHPGGGSRQQTRAGFSRDFGPPCSAGCLSASQAVASLGPAPL